jgi:hypothetical protein
MLLINALWAFVLVDAGFALGILVGRRSAGVTGGHRLMVRITDTDAAAVRVVAVDAAGNIVPGSSISPAPVFSSSDDAILSCSPDPDDPARAIFSATGKLGTAQAQCKIGEAHAVLDVEVIVGAAVAFSLDLEGTAQIKTLPADQQQPIAGVGGAASKPVIQGTGTVTDGRDQTPSEAPPAATGDGTPSV